MWQSDVGSKQTKKHFDISAHALMPNMPNAKWICHSFDGVVSDFNIYKMNPILMMISKICRQIFFHFVPK